MQTIVAEALGAEGMPGVAVAEAGSWRIERLPAEGDAVEIGVFECVDVVAEALGDASRVREAQICVKALDLVLQSNGLLDLCDDVTNVMHRQMDGAGLSNDPEERENYFDAHPWAMLREALVSACPDYGGDDVIRVMAIRGGEIARAEGAEAWRVSGPGGEAEELEEARDAATAAAMRHARTERSIRVVTLDGVAEGLDLDGITDELTGLILDGIPDIEDEDARVDDFDCHQLSEIREAFADIAPNYHGNMPEP
jgi:hypothetical protein